MLFWLLCESESEECNERKLHIGQFSCEMQREQSCKRNVTRTLVIMLVTLALANHALHLSFVCVVRDRPPWTAILYGGRSDLLFRPVTVC